MRIVTLSVLSTLVMVGRANAGFQTNGVQTNGVQTNGVQTNGVQTNGVQTNGVQTNGVQTNGVQTNGVQTNGIQTDGVSYSGLTITGTQMSYIGQGTSVYPYTCSHREDATGAALNNCSPCSMTVANVDTYCRNYSWDSICVNEAKSMCTVGAGAVLTTSFSNGTTARMRIDDVTQGASSAWNGSVYTNNSDVTYNRLSWVLDHAPNVTGPALLGGLNSCTNQVANVGGAGYGPDPYCANVYWDAYCVAEANAQCGASTGTAAPSSTTGASVCGTTGSANTPVQAIFLAGIWDQNWGHQGNGSKTASSSMFTIACRGVGAYAKCLDMGYKPWLSTAHDQLHQSCVRMVRADYCGDGNSFTTSGHAIDVQDHISRNTTNDIQVYASTLPFEASWDLTGANFVDHVRIAYQPSAYDGTAVNAYIGSRSAYCHIESPWSGPENAQADGIVNLLTNKSE